MKKRVSPKMFVKVWQTSRSVEEVAERLTQYANDDITPQFVTIAERLYRQEGVRLKVMRV